jgi:hypothetical protein
MRTVSLLLAFLAVTIVLAMKATAKRNSRKIG